MKLLSVRRLPFVPLKLRGEQQTVQRRNTASRGAAQLVFLCCGQFKWLTSREKKFQLLSSQKTISDTISNFLFYLSEDLVAINCFVPFLLQTYGNSYSVANSVNSETFSADSPYFPFSNAPKRPPQQGMLESTEIRKIDFEIAFLCFRFGGQTEERGAFKN